MMNSELLDIVVRLGAALGAGGLIGLERSYHGRPAGFRTHTLVCLSSALLMLVTVYESQWFVPHGDSRVVIDPTRMAQGIMTGIGFYVPALLAVAATLGTLSSFRWIESRMPTEFYAQFHIKFRRATVMAEADLRAMAKEAGFSIANMTFALTDDGQSFEYHMGIKTLNPGNLHMLSERLKGESSVVEFRITPVGA